MKSTLLLVTKFSTELCNGFQKQVDLPVQIRIKTLRIGGPFPICICTEFQFSLLL